MSLMRHLFHCLITYSEVAYISGWANTHIYSGKAHSTKRKKQKLYMFMRATNFSSFVFFEESSYEVAKRVSFSFLANCNNFCACVYARQGMQNRVTPAINYLFATTVATLTLLSHSSNLTGFLKTSSEWARGRWLNLTPAAPLAFIAFRAFLTYTLCALCVHSFKIPKRDDRKTYITHSRREYTLYS